MSRRDRAALGQLTRVCVGQSEIVPGGEAAGCSPRSPGLLGILIQELTRAGSLSG